jgi:hypothetical protein
MEVSLADILQGIFEMDGLLTYADETLTIECQAKGMLSRTSLVETFSLSLDVLREVVFKRRIAGSKITLRPKRLSSFEDVPISTNAEIVLKVKRADRKEAEALVSHIQRIISYRGTPGGMSPIPFRVPDVGLREIKGHLYLEGDEFLVFDVENALVGELDTNRHLIKVAPRALREVDLSKGRIRDRLHIRPKGRDLLEAMPGSFRDELTLKIRRKYRDDVVRLMYELARLKNRDSAPGDEHAGSTDAPDAANSANAADSAGN